MASIYLNKNVLSGSAEYTAIASVQTGGRSLNGEDSLNIQFDNDVIIDDIVISGIGTADLNLEMYLVFPTGHAMPVVTSAGAVAAFQVSGPAGANVTYQLNSNEDNRNMWFRIPKWSTLQITAPGEAPTAGGFQVSVIGRG
jgi:hypothetical protein